MITQGLRPCVIWSKEEGMGSFISIGATAFSISLICLSLAESAQPADAKALAREVNAEIRKAENMTDKAAAKTAVAAIHAKIEKIRSMDPNFFELRALDSKYKRLVNIFGGGAPATAPPAASSASPEGAGTDNATNDWTNITVLHKNFIGRLEQIIPTHVKNVIYSEGNVDQVLAQISALRAEAPSVKTYVESFAKKYGRDRNGINDKMEQLRNPKNPRPSPTAGECFEELSDGLTNLEEAPKLEAKKILAAAVQNIDKIESFTADTERDKRYGQVDAKLRLALKFNPADQQIKDWIAKIAAMRVKSKADIETAIDGAQFPAAFAGFTGPGNSAELAASCVKYFNASDPSQTTVQVRITGNWVVAKKNIFGEPVQWGLPIWAVGYHNDNKDIARVIKMTMITGEGLGIAKSPPWTGAWVGDSFQMRTKNIR
jgi:hypothetical protein